MYISRDRSLKSTVCIIARDQSLKSTVCIIIACDLSLGEEDMNNFMLITVDVEKKIQNLSQNNQLSKHELVTSVSCKWWEII